jgi:sugar O-acyltransferase (sialic acid O-acetyltransferase NeuD family)
MAKDLFVIGGGSLAQEVIDISKEIGFYVQKVYVESYYIGQSELLNPLNDIFHIPVSSSVFVAVGSNYDRFRLVKILNAKRKDLVFPSLIHPSAQIAEKVTLGEGCLILRNAVIATNASLGNFVLVNNLSLIDHNAEVGDFVSVGPHSTLLGHSKVGILSFVGANSCILQRKSIGEKSALGAMSFLNEDLPSGELWVGSPAQKIRSYDFRSNIYQSKT